MPGELPADLENDSLVFGHGVSISMLRQCHGDQLLRWSKAAAQDLENITGYLLEKTRGMRLD